MNWLFLGSVSGFLGVALGAFGAHALKDRLDAYSLGVWQTAVQYQLWHALALVLAGILMRVPGSDSRWVGFAGWAFALGTFFFSGSLFTLALSGVRAWGAVTPIGGLGFLLGWIALARVGMKL